MIIEETDVLTFEEYEDLITCLQECDDRAPLGADEEPWKPITDKLERQMQVLYPPIVELEDPNAGQ